MKSPPTFLPRQVDVRPVEEIRAAFESMLTIRRFEERAQDLFAASSIRGSIHLGIGQEAVAVGARLASRPGDIVAPTYRGHAYALAWGLSPDAGFRELLGRDSGSNRGRGGSKHFADVKNGVLPSNAIVAASLPIACGTALAAKLDGTRLVTIVPFGDGATNQGAFHEALNLAAIWDLPVIFLCENNLYSEMTPISTMVRVPALVDRAAAYGIPGESCDGMDLESVTETVGAAVVRARAGLGPTLIEARTYRFCGHMPGDSEPYRTKEEVAAWRDRDPITSTRIRLRDRGIDDQEMDEIAARIEDGLERAQTEALAAPEPDPAAIGLGAADWMEYHR